jgi:predicted RNase H-like HicB family nuclease
LLKDAFFTEKELSEPPAPSKTLQPGVLRAGAVSVKKIYGMKVDVDGDGWFVGTVAGLEECHAQGESREEMLDNLREAIELAMEAQGKSEVDVEFLDGDRVEVST